MDVLAALADPVRRDLLDLLRHGPRAAGELAAAFPVSRPAISRHLRILREHGLVRVEGDDDGRTRIYRLDVGPLAEVDAWLAPFRSVDQPPFVVAGALDALDTEVRRTVRDRRRTAGTDIDTDTRSTA